MISKSKRSKYPVRTCTVLCMEGEDESSADSEGPQTLCFKQRLEKSTGGEVMLMEWSPTMDLLAAVFKDHSVALYRLSWQRVWMVAPANTLITAIAWRPDGKVLAVGHRDGVVGLHDVENGHTLNEFAAGAAITSLHWTKLTEEGESSTSMEGVSYKEKWSHFLPPLPSVENREEAYPVDPKKLQPTDSLKSLHMLLVGDVVGKVHLCVLGVFRIAAMNTSGDHVMISRMSHDFKQVFNLTLTRTQAPSPSTNVTLQTSNTSLIYLRSRELQHMAIEFGHVSCHLDYMNSALKAMYEAWDDLLFNMDSQLAGYSQTLPEGRTVSDEFLVLLACGQASQKLQDFLITELTAKGVQKLGLSLEHSYENIKKFLLHHFQSGLQGLQLHLGEVLAMSRWYDRFGILGLSEDAVQKCINEAGALSLKSQEMPLVIDHSLQSIKVFFQWLYVVILKLSHNQAMPKSLREDLTPDELKLIIDFLKKRLTKAKEGEHAFNLETVGQYLDNKDLKYVEEKAPSFWEQLLKEAKLEGSTVPWLFQPSVTKSLVQLYKSLHSVVDEAFATPVASILQSFTPQLNTSITSTRLEGAAAEKIHPLMCYFAKGDTCFICLPTSIDGGTSTHTTCKEIVLLSYLSGQENGEVTERCKFCIQNVKELTEKDSDQTCSILSLQFYDDDNLSILLQYSYKVIEEDPESEGHSKTVTVTRCAVAQLSIVGVASLSHDCSVAEDVGCLLSQVHCLGAFKARELAVSASRKVAAVVSYDGKKIRFFDVDSEED